MTCFESTRQLPIPVTKCLNELKNRQEYEEGSKRSHHLAAVVRAYHVVERLPGGVGRHEGGGAVVENQAAIGDRTTAGRASAAHGFEKSEIGGVAGARARAALPLWWSPENHLAALFSPPGVLELRQFSWFLGFWTSGGEAGAAWGGERGWRWRRRGRRD